MQIKKYIIVATLTAGLFLPMLSSAQSVADLQAQIAALLKQLQQMQAQLAQLQGGTPAWCHTFERNLGIGNRGGEVRELQHALVKEGFTVDEKDGETLATYKDATASAVSGFQQKYKDEILTPNGLLYGTGYVGPSTRKKLNQLYGCENVSPATSPSLTVLSPNGGETLTEGQTYTIRWNASNFPTGTTVYVELRSRSDNYVPAAKIAIAPPSGGYYVWKIPENTVPGQYIIEVYKADQNGVIDSNESVKDISDAPFSIVSQQTATSSITVLSPNGGEVLNEGSSYTIRWTSSGLPSDAKIHIALFRGATNAEIVTNIPANQNEYQWAVTTKGNWGIGLSEKPNVLARLFGFKIAKAETINNYYILVSTGSVYDYSDAPFSIVQNTGTALPNPQLAFVDKEDYIDAFNNPYTRYRLSVTNWLAYPNELFVPATDLPPCGQNNNSSRTWVNIYNAETNGYLYGFCGFTSPQSLTSLWFGIARGSSPPPSVYVIINDRRTGTTYRSNNAPISDAALTTKSVQVDSPNGNETWNIGEQKLLTWHSSNPVSTYDLWLISPNGSQSRNIAWHILGTQTSYNWTVGKINCTDTRVTCAGIQPNESKTDLPGGQYYFRVVTYGGPVVQVNSDDSDALFSIVSQTTQPSITVLSPNGGETLTEGQTYTISWNASNFPIGTTVYVELRSRSDNYVPAAKIAIAPPSSGYYVWKIPENTVLGQYIIEVYKADQNGVIDSNESVKDISDAPFSIVSQQTATSSITVLSPNGGESWQAGTVASVKWKWSGSLTKLRIQLLGESITKQFAEVGTGVNSDLGEYTFIIPSNLSGQFRVSICDSYYAAATFLCDQSDAPFSIVASSPSSATSTINITGLVTNPSPLTINGSSKSYTMTIQNITGSTQLGITIDSSIEQGGTKRQARDTLRPTCFVNGTPYVSGSVPSGTCTASSYVFANDTDSNPGVGQFVSGGATMVLELKQNGALLSRFTSPVTLVAPTSTGTVLGAASDSVADLQALSDTLANLRAILLNILDSIR